MGTGTAAPTVALIHATPASLAPARMAFAERFPDAQMWNLLDDLLVVHAEQAGRLTPPLRRRMEHLIQHALDGGADAVLLACSMYGPVVHDLASADGVPMLASDDAMFARVAERAPRRVVVLAGMAPAAEDTAARLSEHLGDPGITIEGAVVPGAAEAALAGDLPSLQRLVAETARAVEDRADVIVIAQFSLSPATQAAASAVSVPVLSPPHLAAEALQARLTGAGVG